MYIKYADYKGKLAKGDMVLMSAAEFANDGSKLIGIPVTITPDGKEPIEPPDEIRDNFDLLFEDAHALDAKEGLFEPSEIYILNKKVELLASENQAKDELLQEIILQMFS